MNDSLLDELEKADSNRQDIYDTHAVYQPLLEENHQNLHVNAMKTRTKSVEDADALWAELHSQPAQAPRQQTGIPFNFRSPTTSSIRHPNQRGSLLPHAAPNSTSKQLPSVDVRRHMNLPSLSDIKNNWLLSKSRGTHVPDDAGQVENIDSFLIALYNYYYHNGVACFIGKEVVQLMNLLFTVSLSSFVLGCLKWSELANCQKSEKGCKRPLSDFVTWDFDGRFFSTLVLFYFLIFFVFWLTRVTAFISNARDVIEMHRFVTERLRIDERQIQTMTWDEVVERVLTLLPRPRSAEENLPLLRTNLSSYQLQVDATHFRTPLDFARRIMRKENYMIAFMNSPVFRTALPVPSWLRLSSHVIFSRNMEFNLQTCLLDSMFDPATNTLRPLATDELKKRFAMVGIINLLLTPFLLLFRTIQFFLIGAQEWNVHRTSSLSSRRWSPMALWTFREYNELPHVFDARIEKAYPLAESYLGLFPTGLVSIIASGISFLAGSTMVVLIYLSVVEESILLEVELGNRQLIWYFTIASGIFALARTFQSSPPRFTSGESCEEAMTRLAAETHHFPTAWKGQCHTFQTRDSLLTLFPYRAVLFLEECVSVLLTPYLLCVALPENTEEIIRFINQHTQTLPHVGSVCRIAEFDFKAYGAERKMESSFLSFKKNHPTWTGPEEGEVLVHEVSRFREEEMERSLRLGDSIVPEAMTRTLGESMFHSTAQLSLSHQLMQSQAINMALGGPQSSEYYWLQKYHERVQEQGHLAQMKEDMDETC